MFACARRLGQGGLLSVPPVLVAEAVRHYEDVLSLCRTRVVNGYRRDLIFNHEINVPNVPLYEDVELYLTHNAAQQIMNVRIVSSQKTMHSVSLPLAGLRVHSWS
jgi:hypothetical protein